MNKDELKQKLRKFFQDPDWVLVERMILDYIDPLSNVQSIDSKQSNDVIATEVRGRQIATEKLKLFLNECQILGRKITNPKENNFQ